MTDEQQILVRDRREKHQFSIHNRVIDEWLPIIGQIGYMLYSLYVRMANKDDERSWPGYTLISQHLHIGRSSVSDYNQLLEWCGLIHIQSGDPNRPNEYYILDIPPATPETLETIRQVVEDSEKGVKFKQTVLKRLKDWRPIQSLWDHHGRSKPIIVHASQLNLSLDEGSPPAEHLDSAKQGSPPAEHPDLVGPGSPVAEQGSPPAEHLSPVAEQGSPPAEQGSPPAEQGSPPAEHGSPPAEHGSPPAEQGVRLEDSNNPKQQSKTTIQKEQSTTTTPRAMQQTKDNDVVVLADLLSAFGVQEPILSQLAENGINVTDAQAWIWYAQTQDTIRDATAFVISRLQRHVAPPSDMARLATIAQQLTAEDLKILHEYTWDRRTYGPSAWRFLIHGEDRDERLAELFTDVETLELWYTMNQKDIPDPPESKREQALPPPN